MQFSNVFHIDLSLLFINFPMNWFLDLLNVLPPPFCILTFGETGKMRSALKKSNDTSVTRLHRNETPNIGVWAH